MEIIAMNENEDSTSDNSNEESEDETNENINENSNESDKDDSGDNSEDKDGNINENSNESNKNDSGDNSGEEDGNKFTNAGWADSIANILKTNKPKGKKTLVLSRAKKLSEVKIKLKPKEVGFDIEGEIKEEKPDPLELLDKIEDVDVPLRKKRKEIPRIRVKPNILDKDRERTLSKVATRGVVQLFNAVRTQQKDIEQKLEEAGPLERKKEKVLKSVDKRQFLNVLMGGEAKSQKVDEDVKDETEEEQNSETDDNGPKTTIKPQNDAKWNVLREDFMMGAKFKDWDKE